ncbi:MAG: PhzF family phenazine biosynthesis protein [Ilumatobacter sp.]|nr:PhzF family phenazine biosynthesis protein [Ilumatobacter sp.]
MHVFHQVDVFASGPYSGNPLAVVHDADDLTTEQMAAITRWTNLSEASFLLAPTVRGADYRVRIFEPKAELPFAGHPTLGSCAAWLAAGGTPRDGDVVVQECGAGLVTIRRSGQRLAFAAPPMVRFEPVDRIHLERVVRLLGLQSDDVVAAQWIDNGPGWLGLLLADARSVLEVSVPTEPATDFDVGIVGPHEPGAECAVEVRAFFNGSNGTIREDPVTGSLNASIAQWLVGNGTLTAPYVAAQGTALGRRGRVFIDQDGDSVWVGGETSLRISGMIAV